MAASRLSGAAARLSGAAARVYGRVYGRVALVTGAGSIGPGWGNGKAAAVLYAREGARVLAVDADLAAAEETTAIIRAEGGEASAFQADVSDSAQVRAAVDACLAAYQTVDILHNNVGVPIVGSVEDTNEEEWDRAFAVNVRSMYLTSRYCLPHMDSQQRGAIVNISSIVSITHLGEAAPTTHLEVGPLCRE